MYADNEKSLYKFANKAINMAQTARNLQYKLIVRPKVKKKKEIST